MKAEIWKPVKNFVGYYEVSSIGRIRSLSRNIMRKNGRILPIKEKLLIPTLSMNGYLKVNLKKNGKCNNKEIHLIMAEVFLNHIPSYELVVNHIDFNKQNNVLSNLEIVKARINTNKLHLKSTSKYVGVSWKKSHNKWCAQISHNGKQVYLGLFENEEDAANTYNDYLQTIN